MIVSLTGYVLDTAGADPRSTADVHYPAGETGQVSIAVKSRSGSAYDLTGGQLLLSIEKYGVVKVSRQATIDNAAQGLAHFPLVVADTVGLDGDYLFDVWLTTSDGSRYQIVRTRAWIVDASQGEPAQSVTVPASQQPLAQGPKGDTGATGATGATGPQGPAGDAGLPSQTGNGGKVLGTDGTALAWVSGGSASGTPAGWISVADFNAANNGTVNASAAFQSAWNAAVDVNGLCKTIFVPPGEYLIADVVSHLSDKFNFRMTGCGDQSIIRIATGSGGNGLYVGNARICEFDHLSFQGSNSGRGNFDVVDAQAMIYISTTQSYWVHDVVFNAPVHGYGCITADGAGGRISRVIWNGSTGLGADPSMVFGTNLAFAGLLVEDCRYSDIPGYIPGNFVKVDSPALTDAADPALGQEGVPTVILRRCLADEYCWTKLKVAPAAGMYWSSVLVEHCRFNASAIETHNEIDLTRVHSAVLRSSRWTWNGSPNNAGVNLVDCHATLIDDTRFLTQNGSNTVVADSNCGTLVIRDSVTGAVTSAAATTLTQGPFGT